MNLSLAALLLLATAGAGCSKRAGPAEVADTVFLNGGIYTVDANRSWVQACKVDLALCKSVERYLRRYMHRWGVTDLGLEAGTGADSTQSAPNERGQPWQSEWEANARAYWQPSDYVILAVGGEGFRDEVTATGRMLSLGFEYAQLDLGMRTLAVANVG